MRNYLKTRSKVPVALLLISGVVPIDEAQAWYWEYSSSKNGSTSYTRCGDPVSCAQSELMANWSYPANGYYAFNGWIGCSFAGEIIMNCYAKVSKNNDVGNGSTHLVCEPGEVRSGGSCTKLERDPNCSTSVDNPVDARLGAKNEEVADYKSLDGKFVLSRVYSTAYGIPGAKSATSSRFGRVWRSNFDVSLTIQSASTEFYVVLPTGVGRYFELRNGQFIAREYNRKAFGWQDAPHVKEKMRKVGSTYELITTDNTIYSFSADENLSSISYTDGYTQALTWADGKNTAITDSFGNTIKFEYGPNGYVARTVLPGNAAIKYDYINKSTVAEPILHPEYALANVIFPDATPESDSDNPIFRYHYEDTNFPYALTGKTDERGVRIRSWSYDADGRVSTITLPENQGIYTFAYDITNEYTTVTNPLGKKTIYRYNTNVPGASRLLMIDGVASANCAASNTTYTYDSKGFISKEVDAEGRSISYSNDSFGSPISITRGTP